MGQGANGSDASNSIVGETKYLTHLFKVILLDHLMEMLLTIPCSF